MFVNYCSRNSIKESKYFRLLSLHLCCINAFVCRYWLRYFVYKVKFVLLPTMKPYRRIRIMTPSIFNPETGWKYVLSKKNLGLLKRANCQSEQHLWRSKYCELVYPDFSVVVFWMYTSWLSENLTLRRLMSYIYGAPILDVSRSHTTTQHSR